MSTTSTTGRFAGRTVIVTGAGSGIGRATTERLLAEGARVVAADISELRLGELAAAHAGEPLVTIVADVSAPADVERVVAAAEGRVDGLANVAGIMDGFVPVGEVTDEHWAHVFSVNLDSMMRLSRAVIPLMVGAGRGAIVNVASEASLRGSAAGVAYTASKHAVVGLTTSTAFFYAPRGVRANAVAPGGVVTNIDGSFASDYGRDRVLPYLAANVPAPARAEQLASAITWLLSDDASDVNGVVLPVDGGWSAI